jgi:hypothetical protein
VSDNEKMDRVGNELWQRTKTDWVLTLSHDLTEPTCPTAVIRPADRAEKLQYWRADADTIDEAISRVVDLAHAALFDGAPGTGTPWSEPTLAPVPTSQAHNKGNGRDG